MRYLSRSPARAGLFVASNLYGGLGLSPMASFTQMALSVGELVTLPLFLIAAEGIVADFKLQVRRMAERRSTRRSEGWVGRQSGNQELLFRL